MYQKLTYDGYNSSLPVRISSESRSAAKSRLCLRGKSRVHGVYSETQNSHPWYILNIKGESLLRRMDMRSYQNNFEVRVSVFSF